MREDNERDRADLAPEAAQEQNIEPEERAAEAPAAEAPAAEPSGETPAEETAPEGPKPRREGDRRKRCRKRSSAVVPLVIALVAVLLIFGVLVGYMLGRTQNGRELSAEEVEPETGAAEDVPAYDAFSEELTMENQQALDALSGEPAPMDEGASALLGEDAFFEEEPAEEAPVEESVVVAEFGDGEQLMSGEVRERYNEELASYILAGYSEEEVAEMLLDDVLYTMVSERVLSEHAQEMGIYELTDEDRAQIEAQAEADYADALAVARIMVATSDMTDEQADAAAEAYLLETEGVSRESVRAELEASWWEHKLYDALTADVTVDEAQVQAAYDERVEEQRESFAAYPDDFEFSQRNGEILCYNLPGYRAVKVLLIGFDDPEAEMAVFALTDEFYTLEGEAPAADAQERQAQLDAYYAGPEARAKQALEELRAGADMDEMILSIGRDEGMRDDRLRAQGYYVSTDSLLWSEEFVAAAMALENVGDYSEPVRTDEGVCILQYLGDVPEGEVPLDEVHDALEDEVLSMARDEAYMAQTDAWVEEANPTYYPERMQ